MKDKSIIRNLTLILCTVLAFSGCDTVDPVSTTPESPVVIPEDAFTLDLNVFAEETAATEAGKSNAAITNWLNAAIRAGVATHVTHAILDVPFKLTRAIQHVPPVFVDGAFVWAADSLIDGQLHAIYLEARVIDNYVDWEMQVTGVMEETGVSFENFVLYTARTYTDAMEGNFQIYFPVETGSQMVMDGSYEKVDTTGKTLEFTIPAEVEDIGGASAFFNQSGEQITLELVDPSGGTHLMEWSRRTHAGSLTASDYNNGERACWNESLQNVECEVAS